MARTKSSEPKPRTIRLSDADMLAFRSIGGSEWLRSRLSKIAVSKRITAIRNRSMRIDYLAGVSIARLCLKYNVDRTTVWRITKDLNEHKEHTQLRSLA